MDINWLFHPDFKGDEEKLFAKLKKDTNISHGVLLIVLPFFFTMMPIAVAFSVVPSNQR